MVVLIKEGEWIQHLLLVPPHLPRTDVLGFFSPGCSPYFLSPQGMPACSPPVLAARLKFLGVLLCPLSAEKMHSETDSSWSAQTKENLHGLGRMTQEEAFQNTCCSSQSLFSSVISLAVLCRELAQSLPTPASSKVSPGCPCVPAGATEFQALDNPWSTTSTEEMWLGISATVAPLCLGEPPTVVGAGEAAWPGTYGQALPALPKGSWCPQGHFPWVCQQPRPLKAAGLDLATWS